MKINTTFSAFFSLSLLYCIADNYLVNDNSTIHLDEQAVYDFLYHDLEITNQLGFDNVLSDLNEDGQQRLLGTLVSNEVLYQYGMNQGFGQNDNDIRTIIIDKAQNAIEMRLLAEIDLSEREVHNYYAKNIDQYVDEASVTLELVNLSDTSQDNIQQALFALSNNPEISKEDLSDIEHMPNQFNHADESRLRAIFGPEVQQYIFTTATNAEQRNQWQAGFETRFGYHLYRITDYSPRIPVPFHRIQEEVANELLMTTLASDYQQTLQKMIDNYEVVYDFDFDGEPDA